MGVQELAALLTRQSCMCAHACSPAPCDFCLAAQLIIDDRQSELSELARLIKMMASLDVQNDWDSGFQAACLILEVFLRSRAESLAQLPETRRLAS
jgi:hypothetical protein